MTRKVLITGVSSGIGHALARYCLNRGDDVFALGRHAPAEWQAEFRFRFRMQDLRQFDALAEAVSQLLSDADRLDLVILNAGVLGEIKDIRDTSLDEIHHVMEINTWANKVLLDALFASTLPIGQVVGVSSGAAVSGSRGWSSYALSKATFKMLLQLYAAELPHTHFCSFAPGLVDTAMQDHLCGLPEAKARRYPTLARIRAARGTEAMPTPEVLAPRLLEAFEKVRAEAPSGAFVDLRELES